MQIVHLKLRNFRNYTRLDVDFKPGFTLFIGNNAQGKTNILEAIYLLATLKSFRGATTSEMIRYSQNGFFISANIVSDVNHEIKIYCSHPERRISLDNHTVRRVSEIFGVVKAVVFSSEDRFLIQGSAKQRRRYLDYILANTESGYLDILQNYTKALKARNVILKQSSIDVGLLESFTSQVVQLGNRLIKYRQELVKGISPVIEELYRKISVGIDNIKIEYKPGVKKDFALELANCRERELALQTTIIGPHRDEVSIYINDKLAISFASEGQIRTIAIAMKLAQAEYISSKVGVPPILIVDDIMGELDRSRRIAFLPLLERSHYLKSQVFMTCTEQTWPGELINKMEAWRVSAGSLERYKK